MKSLNEIRDEVSEMFPRQSVCASAHSWVHQHDDGPSRSTYFTVSIHAEFGKDIPFHESGSDPEVLLALVRHYRDRQDDPKTGDPGAVAIPETSKDQS